MCITLRRLLLLLLLFLLSVSFSDGAEKRITAELRDNQKALINPQMGWIFHFYDDSVRAYGEKLEPSDTLNFYEGCSVVYLRLPWALIEPKEGVFNWPLLDTPAQRWIDAGKKVAFRFTCSESWLEYATPKWVEEAGAKMTRYKLLKGPDPNGPVCDPVFDDPIFLKKLENFLAAVAKRYDGNPNVAFIDIGSLGLYGEGHTQFSSKIGLKEQIRIGRIHLELHAKHFKKTLICFNEDTLGGNEPGDDFPLTNRCLELGVTLRDDSIMVDPPPRSWFHAELARKFALTLPVVVESQHYRLANKRNTWRDDLLPQAVEEYRASWLSIHSYADVFWQEQKSNIQKINLRLGYRLLPRRVVWPETVTIGQPFDVESIWSNLGVAPCYPGGYFALTIKDRKDGIVSVLTEEGLNMKDLSTGKPGKAPEKTVKSRFCLGQFGPTTRPGEYDLYISVGSLDGVPQLELPLDGHDGKKRYKIGTIRLAE